MSYKIIGKYIKDLSFNIPNPKTFFLLSKDIENYKIKIDIASNQVKQNIIEVLTSLNLSPTREDFETINTKIVFSTIVELTNDKIAKPEIEKIILVEVPSKIYSELREVYINLLDVKEPKFNLTNSNFDKNSISVNNYCKTIVNITHTELKKHNDFLKKEMKKNFY